MKKDKGKDPREIRLISTDVPPWALQLFESAFDKIKVYILPGIAISFLCTNFLSWANDHLLLKDKNEIVNKREIKTILPESVIEVLNRIDFKGILDLNSDQLLELHLKNWLNKNILNRG